MSKVARPVPIMNEYFHSFRMKILTSEICTELMEEKMNDSSEMMWQNKCEFKYLYVIRREAFKIRENE